MPTTDIYGQGINLASLTDAPDIPKAINDVASGVIPRGVMRFASASARGATLTAPAAGMVAWLQDVKLLTLYDGSAWVAIAAGTQAWTTVGLASGFTQNGNSNGSLQYRVVNLFGENTIMFRGAVNVTYSGTTIPNSGVLNTSALPSSARPTALRTIVVPCSDVSSARITLKLDVQPDGYLKIYGTGNGSDGRSTPPWIGFNGCFCSL
ncbi:hypothetical protein [Streptomyces sp. KL116D]|uniref:hypothetical protein n=1 Tax=Streptomyces sp. KL116D TaxID=3045152 RepID=UPI003559129F